MALTKMDSGSKQIENRSLIASGEEHKEIKFGVKREDMAFIMDRLTEQYNKADMSSLRELISNAIDATVVLPPAERLPIKVTTPTALRPTLVVEDFGTGMSFETLEDVYCNFGSSTKRMDFMQIGSKGLGAKAPLAYCDEFFLSTTHDGITVEAMVKRTSEGPTLKPISIKETGAHSGTKITMPIKASDVMKFSGYMENYSAFTSEDYSLELNGEPLEDKSDEYIYLDDFLLDEDDNVEGRLWVRRSYLAQSVLARLSYGEVFTPDFTLSGWRYDNHLDYGRAEAVLELKPGVVEFISSRDSIKFDDRYHALMARFNAKYGKPTEGLLRAIMAAYRGLDGERALSFILTAKHNGNIEIAKDGSITLTVKPRDRYNTSAFTPVSLSLTLEDFALDNGGNPMRILIPTEDKATGVMAHFTLGDKDSNQVFTLHSTARKNDEGVESMVQNQHLSLVSAMRDHVIEAVGIGYSSTLESAIRTMLGVFSAPAKPQESPYIIHGVSQDDVQEFMRHRRALERHGLGQRMVFLAKGEIPRENLAEAQGILGEFTQISMDEFRESILKDAVEAEKQRRKDAAKARVKETQDRTIKVYDAGILTKDASNLRKGAEAGESTVEDIMEEEAVLIVSTNIRDGYYRDWGRYMVSENVSTVYGAMNAEGDALTGKKLYIVQARNLNAKEYDALLEYPYVYLAPGAFYNCNAFMKLRATRVRSGAFLLSSLENKRGEMLGVLLTRNTPYSPELVKKMAHHLDDAPTAQELLRGATAAEYQFRSNVVNDQAAIDIFMASLDEEQAVAVKAINSALLEAAQDEHRRAYVSVAFASYRHGEVHSGPIFEAICGEIATGIKGALSK